MGLGPWASAQFAVLLGFIGMTDPYKCLGNCPPTPPLSQHFALSKC